MAPPKANVRLPRGPERSPHRSMAWALALLSLPLFLLMALPAVAGATVQTLTFDSEPPPVESPVDSFEAMSFPKELGFRPYRTKVGTRANSGEFVGDVGRCTAETGAESAARTSAPTRRSSSPKRRKK